VHGFVNPEPVTSVAVGFEGGSKREAILKAIFAMTGGLELTLGLASAEIACEKDETTLK